MGVGGRKRHEAGLEQRPRSPLGGSAVPADERGCVEAEERAAFGKWPNDIGIDGDRATPLRVREHRHETCRFHLCRGLRDRGDRVVDLEPCARELDQDASRSLEDQVGGIAAGDLAGVQLPATAKVEPPIGDLVPHHRERRRVHTIALGRAGKRVPGRVRVRRCKQTPVPVSRARRQSARPSSIDLAPSSPDGTTCEWTSTNPGMSRQ